MADSDRIVLGNENSYDMKQFLTLTSILSSLFANFLFAAEYDVYLLAGQSNMDGRAKVKNLNKTQSAPSADDIIFYRNPPHSSTGWKKFQPGFSVAPRYKGKFPSPTFGPEVSFVATMKAANPEQKLALIKGSKGGTSLRSDWKPGDKDQPESQGETYKNFIQTFKLATDQLTKDGHTYTIKGLLWHQGEADKKSSISKHHKRLEQLLARIREDIGIPDLTFVVGEVYDNQERDKVRAAIRLISETDENCELVISKGTTTYDEGTHFDAKSQLLLGKRYAEAILK